MHDALTHLRKHVAAGTWGYHPNGPRSTEPAAWACLALLATGHKTAALPLAQWLAELQTKTGSVGVTEDQDTPAWPTSLALLAWRACEIAVRSREFADAQQQAMQWTLQTGGKPAPRQDHIGHDTTLVGWSWAAATHSWLEPTCLFVLALRALGKDAHPRTREGIQIILDRQLESGGCNYGNTRVLGQATLPHLQPTGLAMLALAGESTTDPRIQRSLAYLGQSIRADTATASLSYALMGLTSHGQRPPNAQSLIDQALDRELQSETSCYKLALLTLAGMSKTNWLPRAEFATDSVPAIKAGI